MPPRRGGCRGCLVGCARSADSTEFQYWLHVWLAAVGRCRRPMVGNSSTVQLVSDLCWLAAYSTAGLCGAGHCRCWRSRGEF